MAAERCARCGGPSFNHRDGEPTGQHRDVEECLRELVGRVAAIEKTWIEDVARQTEVVCAFGCGATRATWGGMAHGFDVCAPRPKAEPPASKVAHRHRGAAAGAPDPGEVSGWEDGHVRICECGARQRAPGARWSWPHWSAPQPAPSDANRAARIVAAFERDLCGRQGFDVGCLPADVQEEMREAWTELVLEVLRG